MKKILLVSIVISLVFSCSRDPYTELVDDYNFYFESLSAPRLFPGESLDVIFTAENNKNPADNSVKLGFDVISGGGTVSESLLFTDSDGKATTTWQLGTDEFEQLLRASVYNKSCQHIKDKYLKAYGFMDDRWMKITGDVDGTMTGLVADTVNDITFMLAKNKIYRQGSRYFMWELVTDDLLQSPQTIDIDRNCIIYVTTFDGHVIKSTDHGASWTRCTKPYTGAYNIYLHISQDNYIWVFESNSTSRLSRDGGNTWVDVDILKTYSGFGNIFRLKNGTLIYHGVDSQSLQRSDDDGVTWTTILMPTFFWTLFVNDNDEFFFSKGENGGLSIYKSTDMGGSFTEVHHVYPASGATIEGNFKRWDDFFYVIVPGYGILKTSDLEHYTTYWIDPSVYDLFIDHNEVLIVKSYQDQSVYYRRNSE